jgi:voltage-gated potassium channel Kch
MLINLGYKLTARLKQAEAGLPHEEAIGAVEDSVVVAGYGSVGRALCFMLERAHIPYAAFELNLEFLAKAQALKHNVHYGDVGDPTMMRAVAIARARLVIVAHSVYESSKHMISNLRQFYPGVPVMTAVQYLVQRDELRGIGAADVFALTPEGTLSFGRSVLERLGIAVTEIETIVGAAKSKDYAALRGVGDAVESAAKVAQ